MKRWWCSWVSRVPDFRPLNDPPHAAIRGWWCSGETEDDVTLCAVVDAEHEGLAKTAIAREWPETVATEDDYRFVELRPPTWQPGDRFPPSSWMKYRLLTPRSDAASVSPDATETD